MCDNHLAFDVIYYKNGVYVRICKACGNVEINTIGFTPLPALQEALNALAAHQKDHKEGKAA